jgi:hypothetical protein
MILMDGQSGVIGAAACTHRIVIAMAVLKELAALADLAWTWAVALTSGV